jgi:hypothetical protein
LKYSTIIMLHLAVWLLLMLAASSVSVADENERRRVDISLSIFPRIVAVDNQFRAKLLEGNKARLLFVGGVDKNYVQMLANRMEKATGNIGGVPVETRVVSVSEEFPLSVLPTAIFLAEKLNDAQLEKVLAYAREQQRLLFSPFVGDVERGVAVGISVGSRVRPYFNRAALRETRVSVNALLMKMSKHYD